MLSDHQRPHSGPLSVPLLPAWMNFATYIYGLHFNCPPSFPSEMAWWWQEKYREEQQLGEVFFSFFLFHSNNKTSEEPDRLIVLTQTPFIQNCWHCNGD